jgi:hypothetical protein
MDVAGHVSRQILAGYSHIRVEAKRKGLEAIVSKPPPAPQAPQPTDEQTADARPRGSRDQSFHVPKRELIRTAVALLRKQARTSSCREVELASERTIKPA